MERRRSPRWLVGTVVVVGVAAVVAVVLTWPTGRGPDLGARPTTYLDGTVEGVDRSTCGSLEVPGALDGCRDLAVRLESGPRTGDLVHVQVLDTQFEVPTLRAGDSIVLLDAGPRAGDLRYSYADQQRRLPLVLLTAAFVVVVLAFGRRKGVRALAGLAASVVVLVVYIVPALVRGSPSLVVALAGTVVVALLAIYLAHGVSLAATVAVVGTLGALVVTTLLGAVAASAAHLAGLVEEESQALRLSSGSLDLRGLLVAGFVVGALGVLDDVTVTQVSTVQALRRRAPDLTRREVYSEAMRVGRDHVASTVNTLVLAYAGAALPLLLFFAEGSTSVGRLLTGETVAVEIIRMLVGSIGLVLAVPLTTALAAWVLDEGDEAVDAHDHGTGAATSARWEDFAPVEE